MKSGFLVGLFLVFCFIVNGQFLKFGIKGGASLVKINGQSFKAGYNLGYNAGAFVEMKMDDKWFLQPEVLYGQANLTYSEDFRDIYGNLLNFNNLSNIQLQRLHIPITLNYKVANILALTAGPQFSVLIQKGESFPVQAQNAFSKGEIGLIGGFNIMIKKLRINGRYIWGIKNINGIDERDPWNTQTAQVGVGFVL